MSKYTVTWKWRSQGKNEDLTAEEIDASNAQRAINKVKADLVAEYGPLGTDFVPIEVVLRR